MEQQNKIISKKDQIYSLLKSKIISGEYPPGYRFPSEPELSAELGVGRITLRSALERLEKTGFLVRAQGRGTFVAIAQEKTKGLKKFLLVIYDPISTIQSPNTYITPSLIENCSKADISVDILSINFLRSLSEDHAFNVLSKANYDGIFLGSSFFEGTEKEVTILKTLNKPIVIPHGKSGDNISTGFATIRTDSKVAWVDAVKHLKEQGHENILTIGSFSESAKNEVRGFGEKEYLDFLASMGLNPDPRLLHFIPHNYLGLTKLLSESLHSFPSLSAILCFSDFYAISVYESLKSLSVKIPDDIAVMGCCGYPGASMMEPPLSTIDFNYEEIGKMATDLLNDADKWFNKVGKLSPDIISPHKLIVRESTQKKWK